MSRIIISDPHGCFKTLMALISQLPAGVPITFAGDLIDRGPDSKDVIEFVKNGGYDCVLGNHEIMMLNDLTFKTNSNGEEVPGLDYYSSIWAMNGGHNCVESYTTYIEEELATGEKINVKSYDTIKMKEHLEWLKTLPYYIEYKNLKNDKGDYLLVTHTTAAEVWDEENHESTVFRNAVTWDRNPFPNKIDGIYNVYGHTPQKHGAIVSEHFACIDTGSYYKRSDYGRLTALQFPEMKIFVQNNVE